MSRSLAQHILDLSHILGDADPHMQERLDLMTGASLPQDSLGRTYFPLLPIFGEHGGRYVDHQAWEAPVATDASGFVDTRVKPALH